ncbi:54S ribosomal protein L25 [Apiospora saccharicola]
MASRYVELAKQMHPRLQRFFAKYPPTQILPRTMAENTIKDGAAANPFLPHKHPATGRWQDPEFSLRRQAELVKLARTEGLEELLPFTHKGTEERIRKRVEEGLQVKGTGVGQKVKGHLHERMLFTKYVVTRYLREWIIGMLGYVTDTFNRTTGTRGWKKFPR